MLTRVLGAVMALAARRPLLVGGVVLALGLGGGIAALGLRPTSADDTFISRSSPTYQASADFHRKFGDDAVYVLVKERLTDLVLTSDLQRLIGLEGCLAGNVPAGKQAYGPKNGPCARLARTKPAKVVFGPGTFINTSVTQLQDQFNAQQQAATQQAEAAAEAARKIAAARGYSKKRQEQLAGQASDLVQNEFIRQLYTLATQYGLGLKLPSISDPGFVSKLVFDDTKAAGTPKARFAYIFPTAGSALIQVRMKPGLSEMARKAAIANIRAASRMKEWRLPNGGGRYVVTGAPVIVSDLTTSITHSISVLLVAALLVMALTLAAVFRVRRRLAPLVVALAATGITFGLLRLSGARLTMASIAVLPVLIGLAVDYAIQLQSRLLEELGAGRGDLRAAVGRVVRAGAPTVTTAAAATAAGFLVLLLSPVPMVRGFGALLVVGIGIALLCALTLGTALQALRPGDLPAGAPQGSPAAALAGAGRWFRGRVAAGPAGRLAAGTTTWTGRRIRAGGERAVALAVGRPQRVIAIAAALAVVGWVVDTGASVESDVQKLVPQNLPALRDLRALETSTGVGGEIDVVVTSDRLTDPKVLQWMSDYQQRLVKQFGYTSDRGCGTVQLCPAFSLPDLFRQGLKGQTTATVKALLDAVPPYFSQGVLTPDRRTATLAFGIKLMPLHRQQQVIEQMRRELKPPAGVHVRLAGLPVLAAQANADVSSAPRRMLGLLAGLLAVALVLLVALRSSRRALLPLVPIAFATGWSALVLALTGVPLNPMSVTLGALVIAISTEFSVLLAERYRTERISGLSVEGALRRAYASTGSAVLASGITAIAGFAVLVLSDIRMLRDFGAVTVIDLAVSLLGVLVVLPAVLVLAERRAAAALAPSRGRGGRERRPAAPVGSRPEVPVP
ncbi:MMPL family transporter [Paraconexibacter antarcticus]|uniref:MMPL family transporter n=1 Tax=Paraconexibacter antarcticus TaxID=2949664 RepID=A0ABY5DYW7_9ACTN|nr:MMPL family transporter [Paraconexibacter antarcticus]UTI65754.1 MMPL family transporter [Paraconexibacter antarcticus]